MNSIIEPCQPGQFEDEWIDELDTSIRKLYKAIPRAAELAVKEEWLEDMVHSRNLLEMVLREQQSRKASIPKGADSVQKGN